VLWDDERACVLMHLAEHGVTHGGVLVDGEGLPRFERGFQLAYLRFVLVPLAQLLGALATVAYEEQL